MSNLIERPKSIGQALCVMIQQQKEIERLTAEVSKLRSALQEIADGATSEFEDGGCGDIASEALSVSDGQDNLLVDGHLPYCTCVDRMDSGKLFIRHDWPCCCPAADRQK